MQNNALAGGGKVWSPPSGGHAHTSMVKKSKAKRMLSAIADFFSDPITFILLLAIGTTTIFFMAAQWTDSEELTVALEQEYGYSEIVQVKGMNAKVITTDGKEKVVDVLEYKNTTLFFENQEQMNEKVSKVQAGTYPEVLSNL